MTKSTFEQIKAEINALKVDASEELMTELNILHDQLKTASSAEWTGDELEDLIFSDSDILDSGVVDEDTKLWSEIRDIQNEIVSFFGVNQEN